MEKVIDTWYIERRLCEKYNESQYFFMKQVKNWPSFSTNQLRILDWLAIKKSWASPRIIWFEIKASRGDFLQDQKRVDYLQYVNQFFFVCPKWMIQKDELPDWVGLMYVDDTWIRTVKRAQFMDNKPDIDMLMYIIHNQIQSTRMPKIRWYRTDINNFLEDKISWDELSRKLRSKLLETVQSLERELEDAKKYKSLVKSICKNLDIEEDRFYINTYSYNSESIIMRKIDELKLKSKWNIWSNELSHMKQARQYMNQAIQDIDKIIEENKPLSI